MLFANQSIRTQLAVGSEDAVFQVVVGDALVASVVFNDSGEKAGEAVDMHLIWCQPGGGTDEIVVSKFHVWQVDVSVVLSFVDDRCQHLSHGVVDALYATVAVRAVGARRDCSLVEELVHGKRQMEAKLLSIIGELAGHPERGMYWLNKLSAVPSSVNSAVETAYMCARRLNRSVKSIV